MAIKHDILVLLRHYWKRGLSATEAVHLICEVEGEKSIRPRTAQRWYEKFNNGNISIERHKNPGRRSIVDENVLREAFESTPGKTLRELSSELGLSLSTVKRHLHIIKKSKRNENCVSKTSELVEKNEKIHDKSNVKDSHDMSVIVHPSEVLPKMQIRSSLKRLLENPEEFVRRSNVSKHDRIIKNREDSSG